MNGRRNVGPTQRPARRMSKVAQCPRGANTADFRVVYETLTL